MSIEAMKQVIEAFDALPPDHPARYANLQINALRAAISQQLAAPEPEFDDCAKSPTGKHSESWFGNGDCEHCQEGAQIAPMVATPETVGEPVARVELITAGGNAGLAIRIVEIDDPLRERLRPGDLLYTRPAQSVPDGWVLMPRELTPDEAMKGQGALLDMYWDATTCFAARYAELIRATEPRRAALQSTKEPK